MMKSLPGQLELGTDPPADQPKEHAPRTAPQEVVDEAFYILVAIEEQRKKLGMTKAEVARAMGKQPAAVRRLLNTEHFNPELQTLLQLAEVLGVEVVVGKKKRAYVRKG